MKEYFTMLAQKIPASTESYKTACSSSELEKPVQFDHTPRDLLVVVGMVMQICLGGIAIGMTSGGKSHRDDRSL